MFSKNFVEIFEAPSPMIFSNNIIPIQDMMNEEYNLQFISPNITKKEIEFITETNKSFFNEFSKLYNENILLKNKLARVLEEKKKLNQIITKHEQEISKTNKMNGVIKGEENIDNNLGEKRISFYRKIKRKRRKKTEINCVYKCPFFNCYKSYPSKGSLNMHIKLKHKQEGLYKFQNEYK